MPDFVEPVNSQTALRIVAVTEISNEVVKFAANKRKILSFALH